jgi:predicted Holliday junction resolvase-like endonuclease
MNKPMMLILILAVIAILAFVALYAYRSSSVRFQGAQQVEKQDVEEELEGSTEEIEDKEDTSFPVDTIIEEDLAPGL